MQIRGLSSNGGNLVDVDTENQLKVSVGEPVSPTVGGFYTVAGQTSAVVAASLGANSSIVTMRMAVNSIRKAYITRFRFVIAPATVGTSALVPGTLGLQRFSMATPTGGTARVPNRLDQGYGSGSDITDIRDSNAALTVTNVVFGTVISSSIVPLFISGGTSAYEWIIEPPCPIVLNPTDGLAVRTQVACPATQTWMYSYTVHWYEK
jgi:hypothetical protein